MAGVRVFEAIFDDFEVPNIINIPQNESNTTAKAIRPGQALRVPGSWGSQISRPSAHEAGKVVSPTQRPPLPPESIPGTHFWYILSRPQGHSAAGRIMSMKNSNATIGNRTRDLPTCSAVPQSTALPRAPVIYDARDRSCSRASGVSILGIIA